MEKVRMTGVGSEMQGVGRLGDGRAVFVPGALPDEWVEIEITKEEKRYCEGKLLRILEPSPERTEPGCPYYARCGGCAARHVNYETTLALKRQHVYDVLKRIGRIEDPVVYETLGSTPTERTRNKAEYAIQNGKIGALAEGSHQVIALEDCLLQHEASVAVLRWFGAKLPSLSCRNQLKYVVTRVNPRDELMLTVCADAPVQSQVLAFLPELRQSVPGIVSCSFLLLNRRPKHALDGRLTHLWGEKALEETLLGMRFSVSPQAFFQVNTKQAERLYELALKAAGLTEGSSARVLDAFCGTGTITLAAARLAKYAVGVEIVAPAIENAKRNAVANGLEAKTRFICADAAKEIPAMIARGERFDAAILDPPRKGADKTFLEILARSNPERIAYVSCNPATLARDVAVLTENGYRFEWAQPVDMFPWSSHVETVTLMTRKDK